MKKLVKIWFLLINEIFKIRGRLEIIIEKKMLHFFGSHHEWSINLATLSFYILVSWTFSLIGAGFWSNVSQYVPELNTDTISKAFFDAFLGKSKLSAFLYYFK